MLSNHDNVVKLLGYEESSNTMIFEMCDGTLADLLSGKPMSEGPDVRIKAITDIVAGCLHIHSFNVIHFDLKTKNILYRVRGNKYTFKISDFGVRSTKYLL